MTKHFNERELALVNTTDLVVLVVVMLIPQSIQTFRASEVGGKAKLAEFEADILHAGRVPYYTIQIYTNWSKFLSCRLDTTGPTCPTREQRMKFTIIY